MSNELTRCDSWLYSILSNDDVLTAALLVAGEDAIRKKIYSIEAPQGVPRPFVIFNFQGGGGDAQGVGTVRTMANPSYQVKVVADKRITAQVEIAGDRIDEVVGKAVRQVHRGFVFSARRTDPIKYPERDGTDLIIHIGGIYQIFTYPVV